MKIIKYEEKSEEALNKNKIKKIMEIAKDKYNKKCFDCNKLNPEIISLYNGIFICKECAKNIHSKLNKNINLLIDNNLQKLSLKGIQYVYNGGNKKLSDFVNYEYPMLKSINKNDFYLTKAMYYYRRWLKYLVNGGNKPLKPPYEECYNVNKSDININKNEIDNKITQDFLRKDNHNNNYESENENHLRILEKILKKVKNKKISNYNNIQNNNINTLILDNENNYFYVTEKSPLNINNLNIKTFNNDEYCMSKSNYSFNEFNKIKQKYNKIYSKPKNLLTPTFDKKNDDSSFMKGKKDYNKELNIHNSIIFPNRNNNYILLNNKTYDNTLMNNFLLGSHLSRNDLYPNKSRYTQTFHHTFLDSLKSLNSSENSDDINMNNSALVFKKKNLKNSFSISSSIKKINKTICKQDNISMVETNSFQIIPNLKDAINKRKGNVLYLKTKPKERKDNKFFTFYTLTDIKNKEKNNNNKLVMGNINKLQNLNKKMNMNKLLNLIIEMKNKHKIKFNFVLNKNLNKHSFKNKVFNNQPKEIIDNKKDKNIDLINNNKNNIYLEYKNININDNSI